MTALAAAANVALNVALLVVAAAAGALILRRARRASRPARLAVHGPGTWWASRGTVEGYVRAAVLRGSNATDARVRLRADRRRWRVRVDAEGSPDLRSDVERLARRALARIGEPVGTTLRVRVSQPRRARAEPDLELRPWAGAADGLSGRTLVRRRAIVAAVERDLRRLPAVNDATATMRGVLGRPHLELTVELAARADPARARAGVRGALTRFEATTGLTPSALDVTLRVAEEHPPGQPVPSGNNM